MRSKKGLVLIIALIILMSTACSKNVSETQPPADTSKDTEDESSEPTKEDGGIFIFGINSDPNVMNPLYAGDRVTMTINNALFSPLYVTDAEETRYYLAESIEHSEDYLTYTLKLKEGLKWHDGEPLTADDIVFTVDSILDENQNSHLISSFLVDGKPVKVNKVDDLTVEFVLPQISVPFTSKLGSLRPIPKHIFEGEKDLAKSDKNLEPIGSGPFKFKEFKNGEKVELERFDNYFDGKPHLEGVVFRVITDTNSANTALLNGELSARYITTDDISGFSDNEKFNIEVFDEGMLNNMVFKLNNEALQNKDVRKAIAYAIDKDEIIAGVYESDEYAEKAYSIFVPTTEYHTHDVEKYEHNLEKAKELMKNAGYDNLNLKLAYTNSSEEQESYGLIMQQQLKEIGVELELVSMERGAFLEKFTDASNSDFDLAFNGYVMGLEPSGYSPLFVAENQNNFMGYVNKELDEMWDKGVIETDESKRSEIYEEIQMEIMDDMVVYPIVYPKSIVAIDSRFGGIEEAKLVPVSMFEDLSKLYLVK
ncbi:MAG TPA: ABC transporter substrate-binding protein [Tissierellales bacterium]|nr:ABC transporter substrate-binding protein [Tissierellales bacterium]